MRVVSRQFGSQSSPIENNTEDNAIIYMGTIDDATTITLTLDANGMFELFTSEYNTSTGAFRGCHQIIIITPEPELYGTTAAAHGTVYASSNSGVSITYNNDSTITLARSSNDYTVEYVIRAIGQDIGNPSSVVGDAEAARDAAEAYATSAGNSATAAAGSESAASGSAAAAAASALAAQSAVQHYPKIENGYWYVWDGANNTWVNTNVKAQGETGQTGAAATIAVGTVHTGAAGSSATVTNSGTESAAVFDFSIPQGAAGTAGKDGASLIKISTTPTSETGTIGGRTYQYKVSRSVVIAQSGANSVSSGDVVEQSYYHYPVVGLDNSYVYLGVRTSIRGETGETGATGQTGQTGPQGVSVSSVTKASGTGAPGTTDTYNVNLDNSTVAGQFTVYNGADGQGSPGTQLPLADGTASAGSANAYSREDHVHPFKGVTQQVSQATLVASVGTVNKNTVVRVGNIVAVTIDVVLSSRPSSTWWTLAELPSGFHDGSDFYIFASVLTDGVSDYGSIDSDGKINIHLRPTTTGRRVSLTTAFALSS